MDSHIGLPRFDEPFGLRFHFENLFREPSLVYVRVILLVDVDKMGEYLHPHTELETPRVYVCMYTVVMDASTRRWILILPKFDRPFNARFYFLEKILGEPILVDVRVILLVENDKMGKHLHPYIELRTLRVYTCMDKSTKR
jgi:hypothetical protein